MYTKFYDNTLTTKFIKNLVSKTNVPFISTWKPGDFAIRGMLYLTRDAIWKCLHTGFPKSIDDVCEKEDHRAILYSKSKDGKLEKLKIDKSNVSPRFFTRVAPYVFGTEYYNITGRSTSNILGYDATTHFYLGLYLRMLRDIYDLDLMPFYNCYANEVVTDVDFKFDKVLNSVLVEIVSRKLAKDSAYKILSVPVKFGKTYMLAIDSALPTEVVCAIYGPKGLLTSLTNNLNDQANATINSETSADSRVESAPLTYKKFLRTQFKSPVLYKTPSWLQVYNNYMAQLLGINKYDIDYTHNIDNELVTDKTYDLTLGLFEKNLRLLIKVPKTNKSSVVVIEGDYPVTNSVATEDFINLHNNTTWSNKYLESLTVNSKTVKGEWIRPETIRSYPEAFKEADKPLIYGTASKVDSMTTYMEYDEDLSLYKTHISYNNPLVENKIDDPVINKDPLLSPLGLLQLGDGNIYAFSNRLVEYLTLNAINHLDTFGKDIERVQQYSKSETNFVKNGSKYSGTLIPGVWDKDFLRYLFNLAKNTRQDISKVDLTGYVDKDVERVITRGQLENKSK